MLYVVATPVGNLDDLSPRAVEVLKNVEGLACEDTRRTWKLLTHFHIPRPDIMMSYREGIEGRVGQILISHFEKGRDIALCSDGGYPGISDPGYRLISLALEHGVELDVIPGASAVPLALLQSGLPTSSYTFKGYPPRKPGKRKHFFEEEATMAHTLIIFESPYRVLPTLQTALEVLGDRRAAVCLELTKKFQRISRGYLSDLVKEFTDVKVKGEVSMVIAGKHPKFTRSRPPEG